MNDEAHPETFRGNRKINIIKYLTAAESSF